ncbi:YicC/YloC family endoribonuclease [Gorillibacterium sp. sgz5001074]|uniref:YicC/YloC family endoribonuclease n=1 Tax=Gorillibacterium sp. sgz5001074 TaxID=3446695 RepID=UPI003F68192C
MIRSMTGFGQSGRTAAGFRMQVDVKSVNHRYSEIMVRMPREWLFLEESVKKRIQKEVKRGRVDVFITMEREGESGKTVELDGDLARGYLEAAARLKQEFGFQEELTLQNLLQIPDVVRFRENRVPDKELVEEALLSCTDEAVSHLAAMRGAEGEHLRSDLATRLELLREARRQLMRLAPGVAAEYLAKLRARIQELLEQIPVDENRLAMEAAVFADRSNIDEELTRLESHYAQFDGLLRSAEPSGRKLDFLIQEMNREVNTIGSKANSAELTSIVVEMKAELEKIREQVQNIE